jgi:hypothetical protein
MMARYFFLVLPVIATGCIGIQMDTILEMPEEATATRTVQTRVYNNVAQATLNSASALVLQDLGFNIDKSEPGIGLLTASKHREAIESGQVILALILTLLLGAEVPWDESQLIRVSVITRPLTVLDADSCALRITMQRTVWNSSGYVSRLETINDPEIFEIFFSRLSKSLFLEEEML